MNKPLMLKKLKLNGSMKIYDTLKVLRVFIEPVNFSFFSISGWGVDLGYCDVEWIALEMNQDHFVVFEIPPKD